MEDFRGIQKVYPYNIPIDFSRVERVERALEEVRWGNVYDPLGNNCQSFVERVCNGSNRSKDVEDRLRFLGVLGVTFLLAGLASE
jgi:hypothetical protein